MDHCEKVTVTHYHDERDCLLLTGIHQTVVNADYRCYSMDQDGKGYWMPGWT